MQLRITTAASIGALFTVLTGCAVTNDTSVLIGQPRSAISVDQVKLYNTPPKKYIEIAIISADAAHDFMSKQALLDKAIEIAKVQAAKFGANGILLDSLGDLQIGSTGTVLLSRPIKAGPAFSTFSGINRTGKQLTGKAVYVTEE